MGSLPLATPTGGTDALAELSPSGGGKRGKGRGGERGKGGGGGEEWRGKGGEGRGGEERSSRICTKLGYINNRTSSWLPLTATS